MNIIKKTLIRIISRFFPFLMYARAQGELHKVRKLPNSKIATNVTTGEGTSFFIPGTVAGIDIAPEVFFRKFCNVLIYPNATLIIEEKVFFNNYCSINCLGRIEIGTKTVFGEGVKLYDHNHQYQYEKDGT